MKAIVFDWDGTLVDTLGAHYAANLAAMSALGLPFDRDRYRRAYSPEWRQMYTNLGVTPERLDEANRLWHLALLDHERRIAVEAIPGAVEALIRLRTSGHALGLVTASRRAVVEPQLARLGFDALFDALVFGDDLSEAKPHPEPLLRALETLALRSEPGSTAYVGDAPDDMRMARTVGARPIGITSLLGAPDDLLGAGAAEVAPSVDAWTTGYLARARV